MISFWRKSSRSIINTTNLFLGESFSIVLFYRFFLLSGNGLEKGVLFFEINISPSIPCSIPWCIFLCAVFFLLVLTILNRWLRCIKSRKGTASINRRTWTEPEASTTKRIGLKKFWSELRIFEEIVKSLRRYHYIVFEEIVKSIIRRSGEILSGGGFFFSIWRRFQTSGFKKKS